MPACIDPATTICADQIVCSCDQVCAPGGDGCVDRAQVDACLTVDDGGACTLVGIGTGTCALGVCGNGEVGAGKVCDDGNTTSGDGGLATAASSGEAAPA